MSAFLHSDLFRNFLGGFLVGAIGIVAFAPAEQTATLVGRIVSIVA